MKKLLAGLILLVSSTAFSQLDSVDFSMNFVTAPAFTAGLDSAALEEPVFQIKVYLDDEDYVGKLIVLVYDFTTNSPMAIMKLDRDEILGGTYTENGLIVFNLPYLNPDADYRVILETQNFLMNYLPRVEKIYLSN